MRVLLVNPPLEHQARIPGPTRIIMPTHRYAPPVGLYYLKGFLDAAPGIETRLFNFQTPQRPGFDALRRELLAFRPDVVGVTVMTVYWYDALRVARAVKETLPQAFTVAGGHHLWTYASETVARPEFDAAVVGEGEHTLRELVETLAAGGDLSAVTGLVHKRDGRVLTNPPRALDRALDELPAPYRVPAAQDPLRLAFDRHAPAALMVRTRGCPRRCGFCQNHDKSYRMLSPARTVEEMRACKALGYRSVDFYDDNFNQSIRLTEELCREIIRSGVDMPWVARCRVDRLTPGLLALMARAGCYRIHFGVESGTQRILDRIDKEITIEQCREAFRLCREAGIETLGYFILGLPTETPEEARATIDLAIELRADYAAFFALFPAPGTPIYFDAVRDPAFGGDYVRDYARDPWPDMELRTWETGMTHARMMALMREAHARFYLRPSYLLRRLAALSGPSELASKAVIAAHMLAASWRGEPAVPVATHAEG
ncbi:MAG: radical SAM protein [Elusimicrobiota bacterium]|nr:radical SAM protein [Elusimicrobiota bacterium]